MFKIKEIFNKGSEENKFFSREQFFYVWQKFSKKERVIVSGLLLIAFVASFSWLSLFYFQGTRIGPDNGGRYVEAVLGKPQYVNPVLAQTNDADRDLSEIIFSGLMKYLPSGGLEMDVAERYEIGDEGKEYTFYLRQDVKWHDGASLTADDVVFTINTIQDIEYRSPVRINWQGVRAEGVDEYTVKFILNNAYAPFLENATIGILPKHIWQDINPGNFALTEFNLKPIGSGPYKFKRLEKDKLGSVASIELVAFDEYHLGRPYISSLKLLFYNSPEMMIQAYNSNLVQGVNFLAPKDKELIKDSAGIYSLKLPRYFAVFFNQSQSEALADKDVRLALNHGTDKQKIINDVLLGDGEVVDSPILPGLLGYTGDITTYEFSPEKAVSILEEAGWEDLDGDGFREKDGDKSDDLEPLVVTLITTNWPEFVEVAERLKSDWAAIGVKTEIIVSSIGEVQQDYIKTRKYEALLFGQILSYLPDPFSFWHSSQKKDPGLNLALYDDNKVDGLLEEARQTLDDTDRATRYEEFQQLLIDDAPVVFLYSPYYLYAVSEKIRGLNIENVVTPSQRFANIHEWYIKTDRSWR